MHPCLCYFIRDSKFYLVPNGRAFGTVTHPLHPKYQEIGEGRRNVPCSVQGLLFEVLGGTAVKQSVKSTYSDLCQRKTRVWEHLHLFSIIPHICCRMYVIHLVIREITFVANSLPIRNFIEFVYHAVASYEVWKMVIFGVPAAVGPEFWDGPEFFGGFGLSQNCSLRAGVVDGPLFPGNAVTLLTNSSDHFHFWLLNTAWGLMCWIALLVCPYTVSFETCPDLPTVFAFGLRGQCSPQKESDSLEPSRSIFNLKASTFSFTEKLWNIFFAASG